jgi:sortase A
MTAAPQPLARLAQVRIPRKKIEHTHASIVANWALASVAALMIWILAFAFALSSFQHSHSQNVLYAKLREQIAAGTAPLGGQIALGAPVALLNAPGAGLHREVIVEGTASGQLVKGPGHLRDSVLPGQPGWSVIFGRAKLFGGPFHGIAGMRPGQVITVTTGEGVSRYVVSRVRHPGDTYPLLAPGEGRLTLVTAEGSGWSSGRVVYVDATLTTPAYTDPGGRLSAVPRSETEMKGDPTALYQLVLWLPVLVFGGAGLVWAHHNWGGWQSWVVGVPIVLAGLWGVTETAAQFLPNLM